MSSQALQNLKLLFQDRPNVLKMLDSRELDLSNLTDQQLIEEQRKRQLFPEPVNFYVTGRTGAGKTSLGNSLIPERPMESHGHIDCTRSVQYFQLKSNLRYYDLPGAGSMEKFENINRAALLIPQIEDKDEGIFPINEFEILDFTNFSESKNVKQDNCLVTQWQSPQNQKFVNPDVILYVIAPHGSFIRDDRKYLRALLKSLKDGNKVIFALNLHRTADGTLKPTPQNIQDVRNSVIEIYQEFYPGSQPHIIEIDALKGIGINQITERICQILPSNKIGNVQEVLREELKEVARKERSHRYRQTLIYIAGRLATCKVDESLGKQTLLQEAYAAICDYGIKVFREEDARIEAEKEFYTLVEQIANETTLSREQVLKILVKDVQEEEIKENEIIGYKPKFEEKTVTEQVPDYYAETERVKRSAVSRFVTGIFEGIAKTVTAPIEAGQQAYKGITGKDVKNVWGQITDEFAPDYYKNETFIKSRTKTVEKIEQRFQGVEEIRKEVTRKVFYPVEKEQEIGKKYLQGGYPVVENFLAIGLGIENAHPTQNLRKDFDAVTEAGRRQVQGLLIRYKDQMNQIVENKPPEKAEQEIISILERALL